MTAAPGSAPQRIVVVDDSPFTHRLVSVQLKKERCELSSFLDPAEAVDAILADPPDLVLLDLDMPGMSGEDVCRRLKDEPGTAAVPIIFLTGNEDLDTKVRCFDLGAVDYIMKPFQGPELRARARAALRTKRFQDLLATRAQVDGLTGLWNRTHFDEALAKGVDAFRRYGRGCALIMTDIDHFKQCNDTYGHPFGDEVIVRVARLLEEGMRGSDLVCRYGGEEFAVLLEETDLEGAYRFAERAREAIEATVLEHNRQPVTITSSFGAACATMLEPGDPPERLLELADQGLYAAKRAGRNRVRRAA